jgi:hypothetical protein
LILRAESGNIVNSPGVMPARGNRMQRVSHLISTTHSMRGMYALAIGVTRDVVACPRN